MSVVAIAGGASAGLGRSLVLAILATAKWKPIILSRGSKRPLWLQAVDPDGTLAPLYAVDYENEGQIASKLQGVHTLISVILAKDGTQAAKNVTLLNAAVKAGCTRFAPSQWAGGLDAWKRITMLRGAFDGVWEACIRHSDKIECARFNNGMFMNYLGIGAVQGAADIPDEQKQLETLKLHGGYMPGDDEACQGVDKEGDMPDGSGSFLVSMSTGTAQIPVRSDGGFPKVTFTMIGDIGRFVAAALDLPKWETHMTMVGDTIGLDELIQLAETVTRRRFDVEKLTQSQVEVQLAQLKMPEDMLKGLWLELKLDTARDTLDSSYLKPVVNGLCPNVQPTTVREYLERHWSK